VVVSLAVRMGGHRTYPSGYEGAVSYCIAAILWVMTVLGWGWLGCYVGVVVTKHSQFHILYVTWNMVVQYGVCVMVTAEDRWPRPAHKVPSTAHPLPSYAHPMPILWWLHRPWVGLCKDPVVHTPVITNTCYHITLMPSGFLTPNPIAASMVTFPSRFLDVSPLHPISPTLEPLFVTEKWDDTVWFKGVRTDRTDKFVTHRTATYVCHPRQVVCRVLALIGPTGVGVVDPHGCVLTWFPGQLKCLFVNLDSVIKCVILMLTDLSQPLEMFLDLPCFCSL